MMFPVNRPVSELTVTELLNLYDFAHSRAIGVQRSVDECYAIDATMKELRAEIERRMQPCKRNHAVSQWEHQMQALSQQGFNK